MDCHCCSHSSCSDSRAQRWCMRWILIISVTRHGLSTLSLLEKLRGCLSPRDFSYLAAQRARHGLFYHRVLLHLDPDDGGFGPEDCNRLETLLAAAAPTAALDHPGPFKLAAAPLSCCDEKMKAQVPSWFLNMMRCGTANSGCPELLTHLWDDVVETGIWEI